MGVFCMQNIITDHWAPKATGSEQPFTYSPVARVPSASAGLFVFPSILRTLGKGTLMSPRFPRGKLCILGLSSGDSITAPKKS